MLLTLLVLASPPDAVELHVNKAALFAASATSGPEIALTVRIENRRDEHLDLHDARLVLAGDRGTRIELRPLPDVTMFPRTRTKLAFEAAIPSAAADESFSLFLEHPTLAVDPVLVSLEKKRRRESVWAAPDGDCGAFLLVLLCSAVLSLA